QAHPIGGGRADERGATHLHRPDGVCRILDRRQAGGRVLMRQERLVDHADRPPIRLDPDRSRLPVADPHDSLAQSLFIARPKWGSNVAFCEPCPAAVDAAICRPFRWSPASWRRSTTRPSTTTGRACLSIRRSLPPGPVTLPPTGPRRPASGGPSLA